MLDIQGKPKLLVVKNEKDFDDLLQIAELADAPQEIINALSQREKIPYFHSEDELQTPPSQWAEFMHDAHKLNGQQAYYYALISNPNFEGINEPEIISYQQYRDRLSSL